MFAGMSARVVFMCFVTEEARDYEPTPNRSDLF